MRFARHTWSFYRRQARNALRMPSALFLANFQPIVWMFLFGQLFRSVALLQGFGTTSYIQFLAPGIAMMTSMFGAFYSGLGMLGDMQSGLLDRLLALPIRRGAVLAGPLLYTASQTVVQAALILVIACLLGARPHGGVLGILVILTASALLGVAFGALSNGLALTTRRQQTLIAVVNFVSLPLTFLSSMMMTHSLMPAWIRMVTRVNPVDRAVRAGRNAFEGTSWHETGLSLALLAGFSALCSLWATRAFRKYQQTL
jgi:ABC-2 type transport system permease protein